MASSLTCDFCGGKIEGKIAAKYYRAQTLPGKAQTSFMSSYSHYADACPTCDKSLVTKMTPRKARKDKEAA